MPAEAGTGAEGRAGQLPWVLVAWALTSYEVLVASKKFTSWSVSFAVAIHLAGFDTL